MKYFVVLLVFIFVFLPDAASAQLVQCSGIDCNFCSFTQMVDTIIDWLVGILVLIAVILLAVAGIKMVTSVGNPSAVSEAKTMLTNVIIGFVIVLASWTVVDTMLKALSGGDLGVWNPTECGGMFTPLQPEKSEGAITIGEGGVATDSGGVVSTGACTPLSPLTDSAALQMEGGSKVVWSNETLRQCASRFTATVGGSVTSAYRPASYQSHLKEVHTKWCLQGLRSNTDPSCSAVKAEVQGEMSKHGLSCSRPVATNSNHTAGNAIDVTGIAHGTGAVIEAANNSCLQWYGPGDEVHYTLRSNCTCY